MVILSLCTYAVVAGVSIAVVIAAARVDAVKAGMLGVALIAIGVLGPSPVKIAIWAGMSRDDKTALSIAGILTLFAAAGLGWLLNRLGFVHWLKDRMSAH